MLTPHCELCGAAWAEVWTIDGMRITLCRSCINDIDAVDLGTIHDDDLQPYEPEELDEDQSWQYLGPKKDHGSNFDW